MKIRKLTPKQVREIRELRNHPKRGVSGLKHIAARFGVSAAHVSRICRGEACKERTE